MELIITAVAIYLVMLIVHIVVFRHSDYLRDHIDPEYITPTTWCVIWPLSWLFSIVYFCLYSISRLLLVFYCIVEYFVSNQWNFTW